VSDLTGADHEMIQRMLAKSAAPLTVDNRVAVLCQGDDKLLRLLQDIREAKRSIYLQYFIIRNDPTSKILLQSLERQAAAGLRRLLWQPAQGRRVGGNLCPALALPAQVELP